MKSKLWFKIFGAGFVILLLSGGLGYVSVSQLKRNAYLADASRTLLLIVTDNPGRRQAIRQEIQALRQRTSGYIEKYKNSIFEAEDKANCQALLKERADYIQIRERVIEPAFAGEKMRRWLCTTNPWCRRTNA